MLHNKILIAALVVIVTGALLYAVHDYGAGEVKKDETPLDTQLTENGKAPVSVDETSTVENRVIAGGDSTISLTLDTEKWDTYTSPEWGVSFKYPQGWKVIEQRVLKQGGLGTRNKAVGALLRVWVEGDGYYFKIHQDGRGLYEDRPYTNPTYIIDGREAKTAEDNTGIGFSLQMTVPVEDLPEKWIGFIAANKAGKSKVVTDLMLSTVRLSAPIK